MVSLHPLLASLLLATPAVPPAPRAPTAEPDIPAAPTAEAEAPAAPFAAAAPGAAEAVAAPDPDSPHARLLGDWPGDEKRVSIGFDRIRTRDALAQLAAEAGWSLDFEDRPGGKVDLQLNDMPADQALDAILAKHGLVANRRGNLVTIEEADDDDEPDRSGTGAERGPEQVGLFNAVHVPEGETVREAVSVFSDVEVDGTVLKDAVSVFGNVRVDGSVHHDAVSVFGNVTLGPKAVVDHSAVSVGGKLDIDPNAVVRGDKVSLGLDLGGVKRAADRARAEPEKSWIEKQITGFVGTLMRYALLFVLGLLLMAFVPTRLRVVSRELQRSPGACAAVGLVGMIALVPLTILLAVTVVGIVALPFLWLLVPVALLLGYISLAMFIGARFPSRNPRRSQVLALALGVAVLFVVDLVPFLGGLALFVLSLVVFGAVLRTRFGSGPQNDANFAPAP